MITTLSATDMAEGNAIVVEPGSFDATGHYYPRVLNAQVHSMVSFFTSLGLERIVTRYCHLHPRVKPDRLRELLCYRPRYFRWGGADLIHTTNLAGRRQMVVIETNSCPSGQKSTPLLDEHEEQGGYRRVLESALVPLLGKEELPEGGLAVIYDKNQIEASGYAAVLADLTHEPVYLTPFPAEREDPPVRFTEGVLEVRDAEGAWHGIRAAFRYVTQRPWNRIPVSTRSMVFNPVIACLAGGRNKLVASKAYDLLNAEVQSDGLEIRTPETIHDVRQEEVRLWVERFGGHAVIKVPYSNSGQGVYTITNATELDRFMSIPQRYARYIVQSLIGDADWSSRGSRGRFYHVGTIPDKAGRLYAFDLRLMIAAGQKHLYPIAMYARRAKMPLASHLTGGESSWEMLGTNLSIKASDGGWQADTDRLMLMDRRDFNRVGIGLDDLIDGFIQACLALIAIDRMAIRLVRPDGTLDIPLFRSLNDDPALVREIV